MTSRKICVTPQPMTSHIKETTTMTKLASVCAETATNITFSCMRISPSVAHMLNTGGAGSSECSLGGCVHIPHKPQQYPRIYSQLHPVSLHSCAG